MKTARRREGEGREREFCVEIKEPRLRESFFPHFFPPFFSSRLEAKGRDEMMNTPLHVDGTENASELFLFFLKLKEKKKKKSAASSRLSLLNTSKGD